jgi:uncharacterized protein (TIGR03546 family)
MLVLQFLINFIKVLNEQASPRAIAGGVALGAVIGLTPTGSFHNAVILLLIFFLTVNKSAALFSALLFSLIAPLGAPLYDRLGRFLLVDMAALRPFWTVLYNTPVVPWTKFYNTRTLGSLMVALVLFWPIFVGVTRGVERYREQVVARFRQWKVFHLLKASTWYQRLERFL